MQNRLRFLKNSAANLGRGSTSALVALVLPPILIRHMSAEAYGVWVLVLQTVAYVGYLDFGLQTAVGRYVAYAHEKNDPRSRDGIYTTAFAGLSITALLGIVVIVIGAAGIRQIFPGVPTGMVPAMRVAILTVGISVALGLPASAWSGTFIGLQRFEIPAVTAGVGKLVSALGLILAALGGSSIESMALILGITNIVTYGAQFELLRRLAPEITLNMRLITRETVRELAGYCFSLSVWSFGMLLVTGFDLVLVGRFQFGAVTPYSAAATLITFITGVQMAVFGVIMPHAAQLHAREDSTALGALVVKSTLLGVIILLLTGLPLITFAPTVIKVWIGGKYARTGGVVLTILVIANIVRLIGAPYASILIGTGQQKQITVSPVLEGVTNLVASVLLGIKYGAVGVAWGTFIGACVGMAAVVLYNLPKTRQFICVSQSRFVWSAVTPPIVCAIPLGVALLLAAFIKPSQHTTFVVPALGISCGGCIWLFLKAASGDTVARKDKSSR